MVATVPLYTDLTKLPPKARTFVNDTTLPKAPKPSLIQRGVNAVGNVARKVPFKSLAGTTALPAAMLYDRTNAPEDRMLPHFGEIADAVDMHAEKAYQEGGVLPALGEVGKGFIPSLVGLARDAGDTLVPDFIHRAFSDFQTDKPDLGPGIEHTPGAAAAIAGQNKLPVVPGTSASAIASINAPSSKFDDLLAAQLGGQGKPEPATAPVVAPNESYFINNDGGEKPGEKQYFRNLPGTTLNDPEPQLPQRLPTAQGQSPAYESPMAAATKDLNLARFDKNDSYADLLGKRLHNIGEGQTLIPALAQTKEMEEQQRRGEEDRGFNLESLELSQNKEYDDNTLVLGRDELEGRDRRSNIDSLVRLRGQDVIAKTSTTNAATKAAAANTPLTFAEQLEEEDALTELNLRDYTNAPPGFAEAASRLVQAGASRAAVRDAFNDVSADQALAFDTPVDELDAQKLLDAVAKKLGQRQ